MSSSKKMRKELPAAAAVKWERVLYKKQPFPDNHTDDQFLAQLRRNNVNAVPPFSLPEAIRGAAIVMSQADLIALYLAIFASTESGLMRPLPLATINFCVASFLLCLCPLANIGAANWRENCRTIATILAFGFAFTPVIRTLTTSIATDSIWAMAILLFALSLVVHDFGLEGDEATIASTPLSVNLCLSASVFLISRLQSDLPAFLLLGLSIMLFCFGPHLRNGILAHWPNAIFILFPPLAFGSIWALATGIGIPQLAILHSILHLVALGIALLLIKMQKLKSTTSEPWDEAAPNRIPNSSSK